MIINDVNSLMRWQTEPASTKYYVFKNGEFFNDYSSTSFNYNTASWYDSNGYFVINQNTFALMTFKSSAPKTYLYCNVYATAGSSTVYSLRAYNGGSRLNVNNSWRDASGTVNATQAYLQTPHILRMIPACSGTYGFSSYYGTYRITEIWFSDEPSDY